MLSFPFLSFIGKSNVTRCRALDFFSPLTFGTVDDPQESQARYTRPVFESFPCMPASNITYAGLPFGLFMTVVGGGELFTGNTAMVTAAAIEGKACSSDLMKNWVFSYMGNFLGYVCMNPAKIFKVVPLVEAKKRGLVVFFCLVAHFDRVPDQSTFSDPVHLSRRIEDYQHGRDIASTTRRDKYHVLVLLECSPTSLVARAEA